jgi:Xaa-Pro dipeptidase
MLFNADRLVKKLDADGLDAIVAATRENVLYVTGIDSVSLRLSPHEAQCYAVLTRDRPTEPCFISFVGEIDQMLDSVVPLRATYTFGEFHRVLPEGRELTADEQRLKQASLDRNPAATPLDALLEALVDLGLGGKRVGVDELGLRRGYLGHLRERWPRGQVVEASDAWQWIRRVKTPAELERLERSAHVNERAVLAAAAIAEEGISEKEIAREFERAVVSQGGLPTLTLIRFGRNAVSGQVKPDRTVLKKGDMIWFDCDSVYHGYWSDMARIYCFGEPDRYARKTYEAMLAGQQRAIDAVRPGMTGKQLFELAVQAVRDAGAPHYRRHHVGHGIGLNGYERPILGPHEDAPIEDGAVINIETPYYEFGLGALHVEDPVLVSSRGNRLLSATGRELRVLD